MRLEAGVSLHSPKLERDDERVTLERHRSGDMTHTKSVQIPVPDKSGIGLGGGLV